jgi:hypothetical protein
MAARSQHNFSIIEAVETLSSIADLEFDREIGIAQKHELILQNEKIDYKTVHWLHEADAISTVPLVKEIFRVILHYLRGFYKKEYGYVTDQKTIEGIKTIMVLVGEAAKKLDKYTNIFNETHAKSVTQFKEYKQLQDFYLTKIARRIDEGVLSKWILGLSLGKGSPESDIILKAITPPNEPLSGIKHVFVDLETVKKDTEYELFFIRKDDGSRFFSPRLLRNIKLVCDFGSYFGDRPEIDPLESIKQWHDRILHNCAKSLIKAMGASLPQFYHDVQQFKNQEIVVILNKALMALLLSSHAQNLLRHNPRKSCGEYFEDFQHFLRQAIHHRDYQKWLAYPPKENNHLAHDVMDLTHLLCRHLFTSMQGLNEISPIVQNLLLQAVRPTQKASESDLLSKRLASEYGAMTKLFKHHPNGPLLKVLSILEEDAYHVFDPIMQHNLPNQLYDLYLNDQRINHFRMPVPIYQETINKAVIDEEFKGFLRSYNQPDGNRKHLLINLQDKTSWREYARCAAIEDLQNQSEFNNVLSVVTLATDTDFYHQLAPYHQNNQAKSFMHQFKEHILGENTGYYFPMSISREALTGFIDQTFEAIHKVFFSSKNVLSREQRMNFIEVFYLLLQLKLIEWIKPDSFSLTCKDGIDCGQSYSVELFMMLKLMNNQNLNEADWEFLNLMLYSPAIITRERVMLPERFNRMVSALRLIENTRAEFGAIDFSKIVEKVFSKAYDSPILKASLHLPRIS